MVKLVAFFKRKTGLTPEAFHHHWRTTHADLVVQQEGLRRYVQNHTVPSSYRRGEPPYDGVAEAWFDDVGAMRALAPSPAYAAVRADEANFIDATTMGGVLTDESVIVDGEVPESALKWIGFLEKSAEVSVDFFQDYWRETHGAIAGRIPGILRYVQCHARKGIYESGRSPAFDGIPMSWFEDMDAFRASGDTEEYRATRDDETNFLAAGVEIPSVVVAEHEIPLVIAESARSVEAAAPRSQGAEGD